MTIKTSDPLTVTALSSALKQTVESQFSHVHVKGEISGLKRHSSGHLYFALKDDRSVLDGVCWRGTAQYLKTVPEEGMEVTVTGRLTTYAGRSKYQIVVESLEIAGEGALLKLLEDRRKALAKEGLFEESRKKPIPQFPKVIGVVTSPTGAVIRDILHRVQERYPCQVILWPVAVQGSGAAESIAKAIEGFHQDSLSFPTPDLLIVGRGGGSLEDLWAFNEEIVVRATANATLPLISAVGHETDTTLIDFASDWRAPTPTAAAEKATPVRQDIIQTLQQNQYRGLNALNRKLSHHVTRLEGLIRGLPKPIQLVENAWQRLDDWGERLKRIWGQRFEEQARKVEHLSRLLEGYSYHKTLERGFLIAKTPEGSLLTSAKAVGQNQKATITFSDGEVPALFKPSIMPVQKKRKPPVTSGKQDTLW